LVTVEDGGIKNSCPQLVPIKIISDEFLEGMQRLAEAKIVSKSNPQLK
jgi:hypothetical protein